MQPINVWLRDGWVEQRCHNNFDSGSSNCYLRNDFSLPVRKIISILTLYRMRMQGYCDVYKWTILKRTSPEVKCLHPTSSMREMCTLSVSNVIYHKFSHGAAFYTLNGKNVNVMLEFATDNKPVRSLEFSNFQL